MQKLELIEERAKSALRVYLERGRDALSLLAANDDAATDILLCKLQARDAAFHNFRALEAMLAGQGRNLADNLDLRDVYLEIQSVNELLASSLNEVSQALKRQVGQLNRMDRVLGSYHSERLPQGSSCAAGRGLLKAV